MPSYPYWSPYPASQPRPSELQECKLRESFLGILVQYDRDSMLDKAMSLLCSDMSAAGSIKLQIHDALRNVTDISAAGWRLRFLHPPSFRHRHPQHLAPPPSRNFSC